MSEANDSLRKDNERAALYGYEGRYTLTNDAGLVGLKVSNIFKTPIGFVGIDGVSDYIVLSDKHDTIYLDNRERAITLIKDISSLYLGVGVRYY